MKPTRKPRRIKPLKADPFYHQMWRIVDGAVRTTFREHPDYIREGRAERIVRQSITKRVAGALAGYVGSERLGMGARRRTDPVK